MVFLHLFKNPTKKPAYSLYQRLVDQARSPFFYKDLNIEDSIKGRFELICLHAFLVLYRLKNHRKLGQSLFDVMFSDIDRSLREIGVGDLSVGKKVKSFAEIFYGRIECYEKGLKNEKELKHFLHSFLYKSEEISPLNLKKICTYISHQVIHLSQISDIMLKEGKITFNQEIQSYF